MNNKYKLTRVKDSDFDDYFTWDIEDLSDLDNDGCPEVVATFYNRTMGKKVLNFLNGDKK